MLLAALAGDVTRVPITVTFVMGTICYLGLCLLFLSANVRYFNCSACSSYVHGCSSRLR